MKFALLVGLGSFAGGLVRYILSGLFQKSTEGFPFGTFTVNLLGCFLVGCLLGIWERWEPGMGGKLFLVTGFLGGFTTFSAFSSETLQLLRSGQSGLAIIYILGSVLLGILLTWAGATLMGPRFSGT